MMIENNVGLLAVTETWLNEDEAALAVEFEELGLITSTIRVCYVIKVIDCINSFFVNNIKNYNTLCRSFEINTTSSF